uniref:Uncharacterized protein n=1 Tax=Anguilla anguilla TaxID=7936 RepID=A0A0E9V3B8_ANGAN
MLSLYCTQTHINTNAGSIISLNTTGLLAMNDIIKPRSFTPNWCLLLISQ